MLERRDRGPQQRARVLQLGLIYPQLKPDPGEITIAAASMLLTWLSKGPLEAVQQCELPASRSALTDVSRPAPLLHATQSSCERPSLPNEICLLYRTCFLNGILPVYPVEVSYFCPGLSFHCPGALQTVAVGTPWLTSQTLTHTTGAIKDNLISLPLTTFSH